MSFEISGYVLEPIRVGQSNSAFTPTPDNLISDQGSFDTAYPASEDNPRNDYLVFVVSEGATRPGFLESATFGWTKNEVIARFGYDSQGGLFKPLPGSAPTEVGDLSLDANTNRLRVRAPAQSAVVPEAPYRLAVGSSGSGTEFSIVIVANDAGFTSPSPGTVQLALDTGNLNWNTADLTTFAGQRVRFQQQQFYDYKDSTGRLGFAPTLLSDEPLILNPLPGPAQIPLLRFGHGFYLNTVAVPNEGAFTVPAVGTIQWAEDTGRLNFNPLDAAGFSSKPVYYDGVLFDNSLQLAPISLGTVTSPGSFGPIQYTGQDILFTLPNVVPYYRFPKFTFVTSFSSGKSGEVQIQTSGAVQFSTADQADYAGQQVVAYVADLPIEHGVSVRLFRTPVNLDGALTVKDVTAVYVVEGAVWADPIIEAPQVLLPSSPIEDDAYPLAVKVIQGQGFYVDDDFPDLSATVSDIGTTFIGTTLTDSSANFVADGVVNNSLLVVTDTLARGTYLVSGVTATTLTVATPFAGSVISPSYVVFPPASLGYFIDFDATPNVSLFYAQRKNQLVLPQGQVFPDGVQVDPLLLPGSLSVERETAPGSGTYDLLTLGSDALVDNVSGVVSMAVTNDVVVEGTASIVSDVLTDSQAQFITDGVQAGYLVEVLTTTAEGVYTVEAVLSETSLQLDVAVSPAVVGASYRVFENREILADRYFDEVQLVDPSTRVERINLLGVATNSPRLNVPLAYVGSSGFRFGSSVDDPFANVVLVPNDGSFTSPTLNTIEISEATGNLNFALLDLGATVYWSRILTPKVDYSLSAGLGLVQFTDRLLSEEEVRITYTVEPPNTTPPTPIGSPVQEYATFLIRKEVTQPHPTPTSTLHFNTAALGAPHPLPVASNPPPAVFRGGRPQKLGVQCAVDTTLSTINFLSDSQITDALPHGAIVNPNERVYVDYYVTRAFGGEKTFTVLNPPIHTAAVSIVDTDSNGDPNNQFVVSGDQTAKFPANSMLRIETEQVYLIGSVAYAAGPDQTTVTLYGNQTFQDSFTDPKLYVSSGPTPVSGASYFVPEIASFEAIARGSNTFFVTGDRTAEYLPGVVVYFTDSGSTFTDFLLVTGSAYDADTGRTKVMLSANAIRQYLSGQQFLNYSIRPIYEAPTTEVRTSLVPVLTQPYSVFRRVSGEAGVILSSPNDYSIDDTGRIVFTEPLVPDEEFSIFYTGRTQLAKGVNVRVSYVSQISPSATNGLLGQSLLADYSISSPDTFYYRVETMTNFRGEYSKEIEAAASSGSSGPLTSNASQPELFEQGRKSLYFDERHLANQDIIARSTLLFYNDLTNYIEEYRRLVDGTVVGNNDGKLLFDGTTGTVRIPPDPPENQIDDLIKVSPAPYQITYPPYAVTSIGTYKKYYLPGPLSRFYPTSKNFFGVTTDVSSAQDGDEVLDTGSTNVTQVSNLHLRQAWGVLTEDTQYSGTNPAGENIIKLDFASGNEAGFDDQAERYARLPFQSGMKCGVIAHDGTVINPPGSPVEIVSVSDFQVTISGGLGGNAPIGATLYQLQSDDSGYMFTYVAGRDYSFNSDSGQVTYISAAGTPPANNTPLIGPYPYAGSITLANTLTEPLRFPALFGGIEDDDGDLSFPIQTPDPNSEQDGYLATESKLITTGTGLIRTRTTAPSIGTGGSVVLGNLTRIVGTISPSPGLQNGDLVRITSGLNAGSAFRRVVGFAAGFIDVDAAAPWIADAGFTFEMATSPNIASGAATSGTSFTLTDSGASFLSTVKVGYTIVVTISGTPYHRQVYAVNSDTTVSFYPNLPSPVVLGTGYRFDNSLATYGNYSGFGTEVDLLQELDDALEGEESLYPDQQSALLSAIDQAFTDVSTGATGQATATQFTFTDLSATFLDDGVTSSQFVYIVAGSNAGIYEIQSVDSQTQVTTTTPFPATASGISYRIASLFGISGDSAKALFTLNQSIAALITPLAPLRAKLVQTPVVGFADAANWFAVSVLKTDLDTRETQVNARLSAIVSIPQQIEDILANVDKLYDARYVWIDARINLENGLLVQQELAIKNRLKAQAEVLKQLTKLLAVEGA